MPDEVIYRCIHAACARPLPRRVNFCPYCGTAQQVGLDKSAQAAAPAGTLATPAAAALAQAGFARAAPAGQVAPAAAPLSEPPAAAASAAPVPARSAAPVPAPSASASAAPPPPPAPQTRAAARPPRREPVRLRYWVLALALLWAIWITAKPTTKQIDQRIEQAIALSHACKSAEAQSELIALRATRATPQQLLRLQQALNAAASVCEKNRAREKAWSDTQAAVDAALDDAAVEKAQARLGLFTKKWGEDAQTRALKAKIGAQRSASQQSQSVRNLVAEAERELAQGNYQAAIDKMEACAAMVDAGNRQCSALMARAERLQRAMRSCIADGGDWINDRCQ